MNGGSAKGNGKKSREGLVRACLAHEGVGFEAERWKDASRIYRRLMGMAGMLLCRIRYFMDGAVIGSRAFVNGPLEGARERFGARRKDGARRMRGSGV